MIGIKILGAIDACFYVFYLLILVRCLLSFFPVVNWENKFIKALIDGVDMYLNLFRRFIPPVGPFDLSPIVAFFVLMLLRRFVLYGFLFLFNILGLM